MAAVSHAPQNVAAPKVYSSGTWNDDTAFNMIGAGGNFSTELNASWDATTPAALGYGHSIGATNVTPPGGDQPVPTLTCTSCHDPHGASSSFDTKINIFRNLKVNAQDAGAQRKSYVLTVILRGVMMFMAATVPSKLVTGTEKLRGRHKRHILRWK